MTLRNDVPVEDDLDSFGPLNPDPEMLAEFLTAQEFKSLQLRCRASGYPPPTIEWYKDGHLVTHNEPGVSVSPNGEVLTIQRVNRIHAGEFTCLARSIVGNVSKSYVLNVRGRHKEKKILILCTRFGQIIIICYEEMLYISHYLSLFSSKMFCLSQMRRSSCTMPFPLCDSRLSIQLPIAKQECWLIQVICAY